MYTGNRELRLARLARAYDAIDNKLELGPWQVDTARALFARREAIWKAYRRIRYNS